MKLRHLSIALLTIIALVGCGGGGSGGESKVSTQISSAASSAVTRVNLNGKITYDYVPHQSDFIGLNYAATERRPVRSAVVEIINNQGQVVASSSTGADGNYSVLVDQNAIVKVRVKAQLTNNSSPSWDFKVTDNTANNALYVLDGAEASSGTSDSTRDLHASSGWGSAEYIATRSAAPFAILDNIYTGLMRLMAAGNTKNLRPLEFRWSIKNSAADGDYTRGEIGTSFYDGSSIYILGDANNDTDEYDSHVLLHEWGHYLEDELFRSDNIGGDHSNGTFLDIRVAMSEGFANAFSGMINNLANYSDSSGNMQSSGFTFNIGNKNRNNKGYFNEGSIGSIFYNFYASNDNKVADEFAPIFQVLSSEPYYTTDAMTSIYVFYSVLRNQFPQYEPNFRSLMNEQLIFGENQYGANESNSGGLSILLPIYKELFVNGGSSRICTSNQYGEQNKLGNSQFLKVNISQAGTYSIHVVKSPDNKLVFKPEFILHSKGLEKTYIANVENDRVTSDVILSTGNYILEIYDKNHRDNENTITKNTSCFDVVILSK